MTYYEILGVEKKASSKDIKKAYRQLAKEWHPDVNKSDGAEAKFKEIQHAYDILSDEGNKRRYDNPPRHVFRGRPFNPFSSPFDSNIFQTVFSRVQITVDIDYLDMILGSTKTIIIEGISYDIDIPKCSQNNSAVRITPKESKEYILILKVKLPESLTKKQENMLKKVRG